MTDANFFDGKDEEGPSNEQLQRLTFLAQGQITLEDAKAEVEVKLQALSRELRIISEEQIPELMDEIGMAGFALTTGEKVEVKRDTKASIKVENRVKAFKWLRDNGHDTIIKNQIIASFGKGEMSKAIELLDELEAHNYICDHKESVHASTLSAFVREMNKSDKPLSSEVMTLLGAFGYAKTKITRPKKK